MAAIKMPVVIEVAARRDKIRTDEGLPAWMGTAKAILRW